MASGSRARGQGSAVAGARAQDTLTNPDLALLPAVDLVVRLHRDGRSGSDFADVALVLAVRERRLIEAEDRVREAGVEAAGLRDTIRALELRAANAEALARRNSLDHQSQAGLEPQIGAAELTGGEIRARDLTASKTIVVPDLPAGKIEDGEIMPGGVCFGASVKAMPAEVGDNMPRPSPLGKIAGIALPAASSMPDELAEEMAVERVVVDVAVRSNHEVAQAAGAMDSRDEASKAVAGKRKETAAAFVSLEKEEEPLKKKPKNICISEAGALGVSEDSDGDSRVEETEQELHFTETQGSKMLDILKAQVAAWESVYDAVDAAQSMPQAGAAGATTTSVEDVQTVIEVEAREKNEATVVRLQQEIILCERRLEEVKDRAKKTEERLCAEIIKCKDKATKTEAVLWEEILLARSNAVTEHVVWKHSATEAQAQIYEASMTVARLCNEIQARKYIASETETCLQIQDKIIDKLQSMVDEGRCKLANAESQIRVSKELATKLQDKIQASEQNRAIEVEAQIRRATKMEEDLQAKIRMLEQKVANLEARGSTSDISRSHHTIAIDEHNPSRMVPEIELHRVVPTGSSKKAPRQKGVSFYNEIFKSEMEKRKHIGNEENEESLKKQAAKAASKALYLMCWKQAPYLPAQLGSNTAEEDSGEEA